MKKWRTLSTKSRSVVVCRWLPRRVANMVRMEWCFSTSTHTLFSLTEVTISFNRDTPKRSG